MKRLNNSAFPSIAAMVGLCLACQGEPGSADGPVLLRGKQPHSYRLSVTQPPADDSTVSVVFELAYDRAGQERIELKEASRRSGETAPPHKFELDQACREQFGGGPDSLGILRLDKGESLDSAIPQCVPEPLFIAITDVLTFLLIQGSEDFGLHNIKQAGDQAASQPFEVKWHRPPLLLEGEISCPGGLTRLDRIEGHRAYLHWTPQPMSVSMVRTVEGFADGNLLLVGSEEFAVELIIDIRDGTLLSGKALRDEVDFKVVMPFAGNTAPEKGDWPQLEGQPMHVTRHLNLELIE